MTALRYGRDSRSRHKVIVSTLGMAPDELALRATRMCALLRTWKVMIDRPLPVASLPATIKKSSPSVRRVSLISSIGTFSSCEEVSRAYYSPPGLPYPTSPLRLGFRLAEDHATLLYPAQLIFYIAQP